MTNHGRGWIQLKCPKCKTGNLVLFKEVEKASQYKITLRGKIYKHPISTVDFETEKDYLECKNMVCNQYYDYELDKNGIVKENLLRER